LIALHVALLACVANALPDDYTQQQQASGNHTDPDNGPCCHLNSLLGVVLPFGKNTEIFAFSVI
jgi:hypothetical protein